MEVTTPNIYLTEGGVLLSLLDNEQNKSKFMIFYHFLSDMQRHRNDLYLKVLAYPHILISYNIHGVSMKKLVCKER